MERDEHYGSLDFPKAGMELVFIEAAHCLPRAQVVDPKVLHVAAFHLFSEGLAGHHQFPSDLPGKVCFGDTRAALLKKMGRPSSEGGGNYVPLLQSRAPYWIKYDVGPAELHFQLDHNDCVELVTLQLQAVA